MILGKLLSQCVSPAKALGIVLKPYGVSKVLRADIVPGKIDTSLLLEGEPGPIDIIVHASLCGSTLHIHDLSCERAWIQKTAQALLAGESFTVPDIALAYLAPLGAYPTISADLKSAEKTAKAVAI